MGQTVQMERMAPMHHPGIYLTLQVQDSHGLRNTYFGMVLYGITAGHQIVQRILLGIFLRFTLIQVAQDQSLVVRVGRKELVCRQHT